MANKCFGAPGDTGLPQMCKDHLQLLITVLENIEFKWKESVVCVPVTKMLIQTSWAREGATADQ